MYLGRLNGYTAALLQDLASHQTTTTPRYFLVTLASTRCAAGVTKTNW